MNLRLSPPSLPRKLWLPPWLPIALAAVSLGAPLSKAQEPPRAEPVVPPRAVPFVPGGVPSPPPRAVPVPETTPPPRATPVPAPPAVASPPITPTPAPTASSTPTEAPVTGDPEEDLYSYASMVYGQNLWDMAARQFDTYITEYPSGTHLQGAYYRLGECRLKLGDLAGSTEAFYQVIRNYKEGEFVSPAAYRLASLSYKQEEFAKALPYFKIAADKANDPKVGFSSRFYEARCLQLLKRNKEAITSFKKVVETTKDNAYRDPALREIVNLQTAAGLDEEAQATLDIIIETSLNDDILVEALTRSGIAANEAGDTDKARELLKKASKSKGTGYWKASAHYALLQILVTDGDYTLASNEFGKIRLTDLPTEMQPRAILTAGDIERKRKLHTKAINHYRDLERFFPNTPEAAAASYFKLISYYKLKDPRLPTYVDEFRAQLSGQQDPQGYASKALLLKAETYFSKGNYPEAATAYAQIDPAQIPEGIRAPMLYNKGWCEKETGNHQAAIATLGRFINSHKEHESMPNVLATRATSYRETGDTMLALTDLERIINDYPENPAVELALQQGALVHGERKEWSKLIEKFTVLLEKFPRSVAAAEAAFYTGKAHYELKEFEDAIPHLDTALKQDPKTYLDLANMHIILSNYFLERPDPLAAQIESYLKERPDANLTPKILFWLGARKLEEGSFEQAERYLTLGSTPEYPEDTPIAVWDYLARARRELGKHESSIGAIDLYLGQAKKPSTKARGYLARAMTQLAAGNFDEADGSADTGLELQKEGKVNAELLLIQGDIALNRGDALAKAGDLGAAANAYKKASGNFIIVSEIFLDHQLTPTALTKAANAFERMGEDARAKATREQLAERFPDFEDSATQ